MVENGYYRILGRTSVDIIKTGGYKVSALEVEADLNDVATKWVAALASSGIKARRGSGEDLYRVVPADVRDPLTAG